MSLPQKKCLICEAEFTPHTSYQKHCGKKECRKELDRRRHQARKTGRRLCFVCGTCFTPKDGNEVVCSNKECRETEQRIARGRANKKTYWEDSSKPKSEKLASKELMEKQGIWISGMTFEEKADAARAAGMSYGKWVANMQMEFEKQQREKQN